jgi:O-antigen/teichoic acid export membrane protein
MILITNLILRIKRLHIWEIRKTEGFKKYTNNIGWLFIGQFFSMVIAFFVGARVAVFLGPSDFGLMSYALSFVGLFGFFGTLGVDSILVRELIKNRDERNSLLGTSLLLKFLGGVVVIVVSSLVALFFEKDYDAILLIFIYSFVFLFQSINVIALFFQSQVQSKHVVKVQIIVSIISACIKILFIILKLPVVFFVISYLIDALNLGVGLLIVYFMRGESFIEWKFKFSLAKKIIGDSWWLMLNGAMVVIFIRIDQVMVKLLLNNSEAGYYAVAVKLAEMFYFIPALIYPAMFPAIVNAHSIDIGKFNRRLSMFYGAMFWLSILLALPLYFFSKKITLVLFGSDFIVSVPAMKIYIWAMVPIFLGNAVTSYMITKNLLKAMLFWNVIGAAINIILNFFWIQKFGILGAAWATIISYLFPLIGMLITTKENREQIKYIISGIFLLPFIKKEGFEIT